MATRPSGYGLTGEVNRKCAAKYDVNREQEVREWMETVLEEPLEEGADPHQPLGAERFQAALQDGVLLCKLINKLSPGSVPKINTKNIAFQRMENVANFLKAIEKYGVKKVDHFTPPNLCDRQTMFMYVVLDCLYALGRRARTNGFNGPTIGPKESTQNIRNFDEETLTKGRAIIGSQMGYTKGASQAGMNMGKTRSITD